MVSDLAFEVGDAWEEPFLVNLDRTVWGLK